jgi:hypothetical protein
MDEDKQVVAAQSSEGNISGQRRKKYRQFRTLAAAATRKNTCGGRVHSGTKEFPAIPKPAQMTSPHIRVKSVAVPYFRNADNARGVCRSEASGGRETVRGILDNATAESPTHSRGNPQGSGGAIVARRFVYRWGRSSAFLGSWAPSE